MTLKLKTNKAASKRIKIKSLLPLRIKLKSTPSYNLLKLYKQRLNSLLPYINF